MSLLASAQSSIQITYNTNTLVFEASEIEIDRPVTEEVSTAHFIADYPHETTVPLGSSIEIWLGRESLNKVFTGRIDTYKKTIEGHSPRWIEGDASGYGNVLNYSYCIGIYDTLATSILSDLVQPLIDNDKLSGKTITPSSKTFKANWRDRTRAECIREVCEQIGYDTYVDLGGTFRAFPIGNNINNSTIDNKILMFGYKEDIERVINSQICIGALQHTIGADSQLTEQLSVASGALKGSWTGPNVGLNSTENTIGTYCISAGTIDATNQLYLKRTFDNTLDLTYGGLLEFYIKYDHERTTWEEAVTHKDLHIWLYFHSPSYSRFDWDHRTGIEGQYIWKQTEYHMIKDRWFIFPWIQVRCPFNLQTHEGPEWENINAPDWTQITGIEIRVVGPLGNTLADGNPPQGSLYVDGMNIIRRAHGKAQNSASISKYDERRGKIIVDSGLKTDAACQALATSIVDAYDEPLPTIDEVSTYGDFSWKEGDKVNMIVRENTISAIVRNIHHGLKNYELHTSYELSSQYIPEIETIIGDLITSTEELERFRIYEEEGVDVRDISPLYTRPLGEEVIEIAPEPDNIIYNPGFEIDSNYDGIPDGWVLNGTGGRSDQDSHSGLWSGSIMNEGFLTTKLYPSKPNMSYIASGWMKGDGGIMRIRFRDSNFNIISTFNICGYESLSNWGFRETIGVSPTSSKWIQFLCKGSCSASEYNLFDDIRLVAIPPPEEQPRIEPPDLLTNSGFEYDYDNDGLADYWKFIKLAGNPGYDRSTDSMRGKWCQRILCPSSSDRAEIQSRVFQIVGDERYKGGGYFKATSILGDGTFGVHLYDKDLNFLENRIFFSGTLDAAWKYRENEFQASGSSRYGSVYFSIDPTSGCTISLDDFSLMISPGWELYIPPDEWERNTTLTSYTPVCTIENFLINENYKIKRIKVGVKIKSGGVGETAYALVTIDGTGYLNWNTTLNSYSLKEGTIDAAKYLDYGRHVLSLEMKTSNSTAPAYETLYEIYTRK